MRTRAIVTFAVLSAAFVSALPAAAQPIPPAQPPGQPGSSAAPGPSAPQQYPQGQPAPSQYPQGQPAPGQYQPAPAPQYPQGQPAPGQYPPAQPPPGQYPQQPAPGQYPQGQPGQYPQGQPMPGQYQQSPQQGQPMARPGPSDPTVETLDAPGAAGPPAAAGESTAGPDLAWYKPISADTALEDRSHERFVSGIYNAHTFFSGPIRGNGSEVLATFHFNNNIGIGAGVYLPNASFVAGLDFFRYAGVNLPTRKRTFGLTVLLPNLETRYAFGTNVLYVGSGLTGLRVTACPLIIDLRLPNITVWQPIPFADADKPSISVGATASLGFMF